MGHRIQRILLSVLAALALTAMVATTAIGGVKARGPQPAYFIDASGGATWIENHADWGSKVTGNGLVNWGKQGIGIDNGLFERGPAKAETVKVEFDDEGASSVGNGQPDLFTQALIGVSGLDGTEAVTYIAFFTDGTNSGTTTIHAADLIAEILTVTAPTGVYLDYVDLAAGPTDTAVRLTVGSGTAAD